MKNLIPKLGLLTSLALLLALVLNGAALADGGGAGEETVQTINGYTVALVFAKPAQVGENAFHLRVLDAHAQPVTDAAITVSVVEGEPVETGHGAAESGHGDTDTAHQDTEAGHQNTDADTHDGADDATHIDLYPHSEADAHADDSEHDNADTHGASDAHTMPSPLTLKPAETSGEYAGTIVVPATGQWVMHTQLTIADAQLMVEFPFTVTPPQNGGNILLGFLGVNGLIVGLAALLQKKHSIR